MHFREIMRFRRTSAGTVPLEVLQALELPMPGDLLEQLVFDHGTKGEFQQQYGNLSPKSISGHDLASALAYADEYPNLTPFKDVIRHAHSEWDRRMSE